MNLRCTIATSQRTTARVALGSDGDGGVVRANVLNGLGGSCHETAGEQKMQQIHGEVYTAKLARSEAKSSFKIIDLYWKN